ncbi:MAG: hypothetical protein ABIG93_04630 [archaeon]
MKTKKELKRKAESIKNLIRGVVDETIDLPDNALVFLDSKEVIDIFTRKRLELISVITKRKPKSIQQLADFTSRQKQAVDRDLKILEKYGVIELKKIGRTAIPIVKRKILMFNLESSEQPKEEAVEAEVYVSNSNVNKMMIGVPQ